MKIVVMGVSGSGKSTIGEQLAKRLGYSFYDADDFHPPANLKKMSSGKPLNDQDRQPWLEILASNLASWDNAVLACSALKESYREILNQGASEMHWIYLEGTKETIYKRMEARAGHYMKVGLLDSQFEALEPPTYGLHLSVDKEPDVMIEEIITHLS